MMATRFMFRPHFITACCETSTNAM